LLVFYCVKKYLKTNSSLPVERKQCERAKILSAKNAIKALSLRVKDFEVMKITEDNNNIYIEGYIIPKGREKEDIKAREKIINETYRKWFDNNPVKCAYNRNLSAMNFRKII
jgi:hypothetical protein